MIAVVVVLIIMTIGALLFLCWTLRDLRKWTREQKAANARLLTTLAEIRQQEAKFKRWLREDGLDPR